MIEHVNGDKKGAGKVVNGTHITEHHILSK